MERKQTNKNLKFQNDFPRESSDETSFISLQKATTFCPYSQEYLSLRARQGKLKAVKFGRNWVTKKEWVQDYIQGVEEYNNNLDELKAKKLKSQRLKVKKAVPSHKTAKKFVSPPEELKKVIARKPLIPVPKMPFEFAFVLVFVLLIAGGAFGKTSLQNVYNDISPYVEKISTTGDLVVKDSVQSLVLVAQSSSEGLNVYENVTFYVDEVSAIGDLVIEDPAQVLAIVAYASTERIRNLYENLDYYTYTISKTGDDFIENFIEGIRGTNVELRQSFAGVTTQDVLETNLETFEEYGQWLAENLKSAYVATSDLTVIKIKKALLKIENAIYSR